VAAAVMTAAPARSSTTPSFRLPPERRMRRPAEFKRVYAGGKRLGNEFFTVNVQTNAATSARLGMSIAARILRRAVDRNRVRRLIRESFRVHQLSLPALDIVIGARAGVLTADNAQLRSALEKLWQKISSTCVISSAP
jgi:ribonuclease P protein component